MSVTEYRWPGFALVLDHAAGTVVTHYTDGHVSGSGVVPDDAYHAARLGLSPLRHRLAHELAHHLVAIATQRGDAVKGCPIIWADAHGVPQRQPEARLAEWRYTAFTYHALGTQQRTANDWGALIDLHRMGVDVAALARRYRWLMDAADLAPSVVAVDLGRRA